MTSCGFRLRAVLMEWPQEAASTPNTWPINVLREKGLYSRSYRQFVFEVPPVGHAFDALKWREIEPEPSIRTVVLWQISAISLVQRSGRERSRPLQ
jgi:hypothetical protein